MDANGVVPDAPVWPSARRERHLDLREQIAHRRIPAREVDARRLPDRAASAVAPDQILRPQPLAAGQVDIDPGAVLIDTCDLVFAIDRYSQFVDPAGQDALDVLLPQRKSVGMSGWEIADVQSDLGEPRNLCGLAARQEPIGDSALVEHLDGA